MQEGVGNVVSRAGASGLAAKRPDRREAVVAGLLACGIASSMLYVAADVVASARYEGYSYASQAVSELNATGAPTRSLWVALAVPYNLLLTAFGAGIWLAAGRKRWGRLTGALLIGSAAVGMATPLFFPMDQRGADETARGLMHGPMTAVGSLFILSAMGFGATLHGRRFRRYSIATIVVLLVFGGLTALYVPRVAAGEPSPGMGIIERVNVYGYLLWVVVMAVSLLRVGAAED